MPASFPSLENLLFPYVEVAAFMVGTNLYLLRRIFPRPLSSPTLATVVLVVGLFVVGLGFWAAVIYSVFVPGDASTVAVFLAANSMMAVAGAWLIAVFLRAEERTVSATGWLWPGTLALLLVGNELLMGSAFVVAIGGPAGYGGYGAIALLSDGVGSVWFFGAMFATMVAIVLLLPLPRPERVALLGFSLTSLLGPFVSLDPLPAALGMAAVMGGVLLLVARELQRAPTAGYVRTSIGVLLGFGTMGLGEVLALANLSVLGGSFPFALATLLVMGGEVLVLARWAFGLPRTPTTPTAEHERSFVAQEISTASGGEPAASPST
ncbi:MAG: hypothetical protein L3K13_04245 [Thermoplasmata archaeon]|nr:hypothetical protein [Thermoplasmata archaeon]